ncbi:LuxR family maltose regulon positive regulatory protein [Saccharothrix tamanrassetensis]|uniref:LuxR family maltose regulon positive regulatory protein n=1 Tax=Saccharothrix tamanrassetensis TaxID=1051531 RepID=A0A841CRB6_9PSEU|nr:AAA family ATPase [Saccharothrix tamanrassetensis]MBB5958515.1 LuxR family maltose regulon positive regulatory protein [Saccharothrix tamanrassetensis]
MLERHDPAETGPERDPGHPVPPPKLRVPLAEAPMVHRHRLAALLDRHTAATTAAPPVTVVTGPAGAGKTTALAMWARRHETARVAWLTLDAHDNTSPYLWSAVREALVDAIGPDELPDLPPPTEPDFPALFIAALDHLPSPVHLVVDDVQLLDDRTALQGLELLVRHTPGPLRLVLAGQHVPPLRLSRLRLEGRLRVVGERDLAFTREEAEELFAHHDMRLDARDVDHVLRRTEGWTAGLRLAALTGCPSAFSGALPAVAEYLTEEVLAAHGERVRRLLVATSVCEEVSADLAAAVAEEPEAGRLLQELRRTHALVSTVDSAEGWFRYHPLLRDHLSAELDRTRPRDRPRLHLAAATWHRDHGRPLVALGHAVHGERPDLTADLVGRHGLVEVLCGNGPRLHELLTAAEQPLAERPLVALVGAVAALDAGDVTAADWLLGHVGEGALTSDRSRALHAAVRLHRARFHGDLAGAVRALSATQAGRTGDAAVDVLARRERGIAHLWSGRLDEAEQDLGHALDAAVRGGFDHATLECLAHLAAVASARGDAQGVVHRTDRALDVVAAHGWEDRPACAVVYAVLAVQAHRCLDDATARAMAARAMAALPDAADRTLELTVAAVHAITSFDRADDPHAVVATLWKQWRGFADCHVAPHVVAEVAPTAQRMALRVGEEQWAADLAGYVESLIGPSAEHALVQAVLLAHRGRGAQVRKLLEPLLRGRSDAVVPGTMVDAWVLESTLLAREGNAQQAHDALRKALAAAEPLRALRPFYNAGKPVRDLLARGAGRFGRLDRFATAVMTTVPTASTGQPEGLTTRERALLVELPSMRTAEEIADSMFVSVNTVKTHLRGIYRKLGVSQRRDAVVVARQRGLI